MRADEFKVASEVLDEILNELQAEYVHQILEATKTSDSVGVAAVAMRCVVLDEIVGTIVARAHDTVPAQPETDNDE